MTIPLTPNTDLTVTVDPGAVLLEYNGPQAFGLVLNPDQARRLADGLLSRLNCFQKVNSSTSTPEIPDNSNVSNSTPLNTLTHRPQQ